MKKKVLAILLSAAMVISMAACGSGGNDGGDAGNADSGAATEDTADAGDDADDAGSSEGGNKGYSFQMIVKSFQSTYWQAAIKGVEQAKAELGVEVEANGPANESDIADQVQMLDSAIEKKPDGIALAACDTKSVVDSLAKALEAGGREYLPGDRGKDQGCNNRREGSYR